MEVLHITPSTDGYEVVTLVANRINRENSFTAIRKNGEDFWTGGFILADNETNRKILDSFPRAEQYKVVQGLKTTPFVKAYLED